MRRVLGLVLAVCLSGCGAGGAPTSETPSSAGDESSSAADGTGQGAGARGAAAAPKSGVEIREKRRIELDYELVLSKDGQPGGLQSGSWSVDDERLIKLVEVKGETVTKLSVTYGRQEAKPLFGVELGAPTTGKAYVVTRGDSGATVARDDGQGATEVEKQAVARDYGWVGAPQPVLAELARASPGSELQLTGSAANALVALPGGGLEASALKTKLVEGGDAKDFTLDVSISVKLASGDIRFEMELSGPAVVDRATGWVKELRLEGKLKADGKVKHKKRDFDARGSGKAKLHATSAI
jgi:hypothetical protein